MTFCISSIFTIFNDGFVPNGHNEVLISKVMEKLDDLTNNFNELNKPEFENFRKAIISRIAINTEYRL